MASNKTIKALSSVRSVPRKTPFIWEAFMQKYDIQIICELGVCRGVNFKQMTKHNPKLAVAVDSWRDDGMASRNDGFYSQKELDLQYEDFEKAMNTKPFVKIYRKYTFEAVEHFKDNYFDLIYVDADHSYEGVLRDLNDWYPKVKHGGFFLGDDYRIYEGRRPGIKFGVIEAVNQFGKEKKLEFFELPTYGWGIIKP